MPQSVMKCINKFVFLLIVLLFWAINMKTQYIGDDVLYQFYYPDVPVQGVPHGVDKDHPISNICDVVLSQINHYKNINGRMIVHVLVQTFCGLCPKWIFDI